MSREAPTSSPAAASPGAERQSSSVTQRLARASARRPWRVVAAWVFVLVASFAAIAGLLGSALSSDQTIGTRPESLQADDLIGESFPPDDDAFDELVIVYSPDLIATDPTFQEFIAEFRSSIADPALTRSVSDPYAAAGGPALSEDGHAAALAVRLADGGDDAIVSVLDEVTAADAAAEFEVTITGSFTLDHDFNELAAHDLEQGELRFGLPAALVVLLLVFGAVVAALLPMTIALVSIIVAVAISAVIGQTMTLSFFIVNMITGMGLALGIDYSLFVLSRYREQRADGYDRFDAISRPVGLPAKPSCSAAVHSSSRCSVCCSSPTRFCAAWRSARSSSGWSRWWPR